MSVQQAEEYAVGLVKLFAESQPLVADLDGKERGHADELLVLAATALIKAGAALENTAASLSKRLIQARLATFCRLAPPMPIHSLNSRL